MQGPQAMRVEARKEDEVIADAPGVLVIGRLSVKLLQNPLRPHNALGQDEHVHPNLPRQRTHKARNLPLIQVPEEKLSHSLV
jgi:hypothetical protein